MPFIIFFLYFLKKKRRDIKMDNTINKQIENIIDDKLQRDIAFPTQVEITRVYADGYVDCKNEDYGELRHIRSITSHNVGDTTVLIFTDNDYGKRIVI